jgi:hypothetical protein
VEAEGHQSDERRPRGDARASQSSQTPSTAPSATQAVGPPAGYLSRFRIDSDLVRALQVLGQQVQILHGGRTLSVAEDDRQPHNIPDVDPETLRKTISRGVQDGWLKEDAEELSLAS